VFSAQEEQQRHLANLKVPSHFFSMCPELNVSSYVNSKLSNVEN